MPCGAGWAPDGFLNAACASAAGDVVFRLPSYARAYNLHYGDRLRRARVRDRRGDRGRVLARAIAATVTWRRAGFVLATALAVVATVMACRKLDISPLAAATPRWVAAALALNAVSLVLRAFAWLGMLRAALPAERIGAGRVLRATMIGVLGSALAPGRAGEPLRTSVIARGLVEREGLATVIGTMVTQTVLNVG